MDVSISSSQALNSETMKHASVACSPIPSSSALICMILLLLATASEATITCSDVIKDLQPCVSYLVNGSGKPPAACCAGAKALASAVSTSADKKTACDCMKSAAKQTNVNAQLAQALPRNCGISLPFTISPNTDCSKVG